MGIDRGFDMIPRLSEGTKDKQSWATFIELVKQQYANDKLVEFKPKYIEIKAGEHPTLPLDGHKFLRFSAKISGSHAGKVDQYICAIYELAKLQFGARVRFWNDAVFDEGFIYS